MAMVLGVGHTEEIIGATIGGQICSAMMLVSTAYAHTLRQYWACSQYQDVQSVPEELGQYWVGEHTRSVPDIL
eukprot:3940775-Rhodomonas_salina.2